VTTEPARHAGHPEPAHGHTAVDAEALAALLGGPAVCAVRPGLWRDPAIWRPRPPVGGDVAHVLADVVCDQAQWLALRAVVNRACLSHAPGRDTRLVTGSLLNLPGACYECLPEAGRQAELVLGGWPLDPANDPGLMLQGLLGWGDVRMEGEARQGWVEVGEGRPGDLALLLPSGVPADWRPGDELALPVVGVKAEQEAGHLVEYATLLQSGRDYIRLAAPLKYHHLEGRDDALGVTLPVHVANLTRSVRVRSLNPAGVRGHCMFTAGCRHTIQHATLDDLGRTTMDAASVIGRYPWHAHMQTWTVPDPSERYRLSGSVIRRSLKWGAAVHGTHRGVVEGNVVCEADHAGIVTEDGSESHNKIRNNFIMGIRNGSGIWLNGPYNEVTGNVLASCTRDESNPITSLWGEPPRPVHTPQGAVANEHGGWGVWVVQTRQRSPQYTVPSKDGLSVEKWTRGWVGLGEPAMGVNRESFAGNHVYGCAEGGVYLDHALGNHLIEGLTCHSCWGGG
jgi:hypothetical protein